LQRQSNYRRRPAYAQLMASPLRKSCHPRLQLAVTTRALICA
jgi:hypothetical protein